MTQPQPTTPCPDENTLLAFSEGQLEGEALEVVVRHLELCDSCLAAVGNLAGEGDGLGPDSIARNTFAPGDMVAGRYAVVRFIARGGMGEVYEATDELLKARVALKVVLPSAARDPRAVELMRREVRLARAISHPGVCKVFDIGEHAAPGAPGAEGKLLFLTMEFLDGVTLGHQIRAAGPLEQPVLLQVAQQIAAGMAAAHEAGVVHRDLKSDNVMWLLGPGGRFARVVIMDFGLARAGVAGAGVISTGGLIVGSVAYMAPEQVEGGPITPAADIYSFGVVLFEAATGRLPFVGRTAMATAVKRLREPAPSAHALRADLAVPLEAVIARCLARRPEDRFASMAEVRAALDRAAAPGADGTRPRPLPGRPLLTIGLTAAVAAAAGLALLDRREAAPPPPLPPSASPAPARGPAFEPLPSVAEPKPEPVREIAPPEPAPPAKATQRRAERHHQATAAPASVTTPDASAEPEQKPEEPAAAPKPRSRLDDFANPFR